MIGGENHACSQFSAHKRMFHVAGEGNVPAKHCFHQIQKKTAGVSEGESKKKFFFLPDHFSEICLYLTEHMLTVQEVKVILQRQG